MAPLNLVSRLLGLPLFPNFPRLPKELRDAIWEFAVLEPRVVPLRRRRLRADSEEEVNPDRNLGLWGFKCDLPPPSILFVNRESHEVASRYYSKAFPCIRYNHTSIPETIFDFERDTLYLDGYWTLQIQWRPSEVEREEREKVKHLAVLSIRNGDSCFAEELGEGECWVESERWLAYFMAYFPNIKDVTHVLESVDAPKYEEGFTSEEMATLTFTDEPNPHMDLNAALEIFENKNDIPGRTAIPDHPRLLTLDLELLKQRRLECVPPGYLPPEDWEMPKIQQRSMVTARLKAILDRNLADHLKNSFLDEGPL